MKKTILIIILIFSFNIINTKEIVFNYDDVKLQFQEYLKLKGSGIKKVFIGRYFEESFIKNFQEYGVNIPKNKELDSNELTFKIIPYASIQFIEERDDSLFYLIKLDFNIFPHDVFVFKNIEPFAVINKLIFDKILLYHPTQGSEYSQNMFCGVHPKEENEIIVYLCNFKGTIILNTELKIYSPYPCIAKKNNLTTPWDYEKTRFDNFLKERKTDTTKCDPSDGPSRGPEMHFDSDIRYK